MHEIGQRASVIQAHARPVRIENAHDVRIEPLGAVIGHHQRLRKTLGFVIHAARPHRVHIAPVRLRLRADGRIAVAFRSRGQKIFCFFREGQPQRIVRPERAHFQRLNRQLEIIHRACRRSKVQHVVDVSRNIDIFRDVVLHHPEMRVVLQMLHVAFGPGNQVVDRQHIPAARQQIIAKVRSQKSRAARDYRPHRLRSMIACAPAPVIRYLKPQVL